MGRSNVPPIAPSQSESSSASVPSEYTPNTESTLESVSSFSFAALPSLVCTNDISSQTTVCSLSPTDDDQPYYDAFDHGEPNGLLSHRRVPNGDSHPFGSTPSPTMDGRASGLATVSQENSETDSQGIPSYPGLVHKALRGVSACIASSVGPSVFSPIARAASHASPSTNTLRRPSKRAVVVGINYTGPGHEPNRRLRYGVNDARRVALSLRTCGFSDEGVIVLTDRDSEEESKRATHGALINWIDWLVKDAKAGDLLVFFFSGHGSSDGSSLVMADGKDFGRDLLHDRLVLPVPVGCDLHIMLDCCSASSIIELQYCIGRMSPKQSFTPTVVFSMPQPALLDTSPATIRPSTQAVAWPSSPVAFAGSLSGAASINNVHPYRAPSGPDSWPPTPGGDIELYRRTTHGGASAVAALPLFNLAETQTPYPARGIPLIFSGVGQALPRSPVALPHAATTQGSTRGRQAPIQVGHVQDHLSERPGRFVKPAGTVMLWASTGTHRSTFEAYNGQDVRNGVKIRNGIVPNAICTALNGCAGSGLFVRDLWKQIVDDIEQENDWRRERDAAKPWNSRPNPFFREQCAELWVSHPTSLSAAGPVLDRPVFGD